MNTVKKIKEFNQPFRFLGKEYIGTVLCFPNGDREILVCLEKDREKDASEEAYKYFIGFLEWYGII